MILTSDTLEETIGLSHTVLVMRDGAVTQRSDARPGGKPEQVDLIGAHGLSHGAILAAPAASTRCGNGCRS